MFEFKNVKYKDIVDIPNLRINEGLTVLLGPSGSGKTTVLRMLNKMISPTEGSIFFNGLDLKELKSVEHRRNAMTLMQSPAMFEGTIRDNLTIPFRFQEKELPDDLALRSVLDDVQLNKELDTPVHLLSGGEKQRVALGRVFLCNPKVYLLDEPSSALDDATEDAIINLVATRIKTDGKSAVMVTHSKAVAEKYGDAIIEMADGKITGRRTANERNY
jgi:putative ABC transport system ATP-binding protein